MISVMKFGFPLPHAMRLKALTQPWEYNVTGTDQVLMTKRAGELGYDMIAVPEHFVVPNTHLELSGPLIGEGLGVTMSSVPIPPVRGVDEYLDYAQWVIEEIKPKVP